MFLTVLLLFISVCSTITNNAVMNGVSKRHLKSGGDMLYFNFFAYAVCVVIFSVMAIAEQSFSWFTVWFGVLFGIVTAANAVCNMMALHNGPMHITLLVTTSSMLIPTMYDVVFNGAGFNTYQFIATLALIVFIYLATSKGKDKENKLNGKWILFCALAFVLGGMVGVMQKIHTGIKNGGEMGLLLAVAFISSTLFSFFTSKGQKCETKFDGKLKILAVLSGICIFTMNYINLKYAGILPSQLFFPVINGSMVVASSVVAVTVFKEPLNKRQFIGMAGGLAALIAICLLQTV